MADTPTSDTGTSVTLVVQPGSAVPVPTAPRPPLAHTGFELVTALAITALLLALGAMLLALGHRPGSHLSRRTP